MSKERRAQVSRAILNYLLEHPDAQDTLMGIAEWWLLDEKTKAGLAIVKDALDQLVANGFVIERQAPDLQTHYYRINRRRLKEIENVVK